MDRRHGPSAQPGSVTVAALHQLERLLNRLDRSAKTSYTRAQSSIAYTRSNPKEARLFLQSFAYAHVSSSLNLLIALWIIVLFWGEVWAFDRTIARCDWSKWEQWPADAKPHHIAFVADPQLIDPHTYPGRPWPLSALTIKHTDLYMQRSYSRIQQELDPNTILFLGDLFDGGREWATLKSHSPEKRYRQYGEDYWLGEYDRFSRIFLREWKYDQSTARDRRDGRRLITNLPGNHDLGFGRGIQKPVRDRFEAFFGDANHVDIVGNHTFVWLDTPSLSSAEHVAREHYEEIWRPPQEFLENFSRRRATMTANHVRHLQDTLHTAVLHDHEVLEANDTKITEKEHPIEAGADGLPTVLLTHVPLYRVQGQGCGPHRERFPPVPPAPGETQPFFPDDANALQLTFGYQYQNVISGQISTAIVQALGNTLEYIFSGDDHDYCEVIHRQYPDVKPAGIREVTVKSISEAMGVRKPGFVLASLWNPIDAQGNRIPSPSTNEDAPTLQSHLCILPDELGIVLNYAILLVLSLAFVLIRALNITFNPRLASTSLLPTSSSASTSSTSSSAEREKSLMNGSSNHAYAPQHASSIDTQHHADNHTASTTSATADDTRHLSSRSSAGPNPAPHTQTPSSAWTPRSNTYTRSTVRDEALAFAQGRHEAWRGRRNPLLVALGEWLGGVWYVARVAVAWYIILFCFW